MKKFSKVLCLVLVVVMMAGLCAVGTTAAYKDADKITYNEAVDVLSAIGVLQGDDNGFRPNDTLTRAEACKILAYLTGAQNVNSGVSFADCKGHWAASYIGYCAAMGYVNGYSATKFGPDDTLTGSAFAKMLLCAMGYDASIEGMTGTTYEVGVARLVKSNKLAQGMTFVGSNNVTREQAALLALNALTKNMVEYDKTQNQNSNGTTSISTKLKATDVTPVTNLAKEYFPTLRYALGTTYDEFGRPANNWALNGQEIGTYAQTATYTYDRAVLQNNLYNELGAVTCTAYNATTAPEGYVWTFSANGSTPASATARIPAKGVMTPVTGTAAGTTTEIFVNGVAKTVHVVYTTYKIAQITAKNAKAVTLKYGDTLGTAMTVASTSPFFETLAAKNVKDYVAVAVDGSTPAKLLEVQEVTKVTGNPTAFNSTGAIFTINGEQHANANTSNAPVVGTTSYDCYVDATGAILYAVATIKPATTYLYVLNNDRDGNAKDGYKPVVQVLYADGKTEWVEVTKLDASAVTSTILTGISSANNKFFAYTVSGDGMVELTSVAAEGATYASTGTFQGVAANGAGGNMNFVNKQNTYRTVKSAAASPAVNLLCTSATSYLYKDTNGNYKSAIGYTKVPATTVTAANVLYKDGVALMIVATTNTVAASTDYVLFLNTNKYTTAIAEDGKTALKTYDALVNGVVTTVNVLNSVTPSANEFYAPTYATEGYVTALSTAFTSSNHSTFGANTVTVIDTPASITLANGVLNYGTARLVADGFAAYVYDNNATSAAKNTVYDLVLGATGTDQFDDLGEYIVVVTDINSEVTTLIAVDLG